MGEFVSNVSNVMCGNTFILKPSEKDPGVVMMLAELAMEAGLPDGVLNIVHGNNDIVNNICDDEDIKAISFVDSNKAWMHIYSRAATKGKHVQSNMGAKSHAIIMPDANADATLDCLVADGFGTVGQRCMALSTAVFVGASKSWEDELLKRAQALKVNAGIDPRADLSPMISGTDLSPVIGRQAKDRICRLIQRGIDSGARVVLDGRSIVVPSYKDGNFVGPTILVDVASHMECYEEEIFGSVLLLMQADSLLEAIHIVNSIKYGNGASIFTTSGVAARKFQNEAKARKRVGCRLSFGEAIKKRENKKRKKKERIGKRGTAPIAVRGGFIPVAASVTLFFFQQEHCFFFQKLGALPPVAVCGGFLQVTALGASF